MPYTGPGSVIGLMDEFLAHWAGVNAAQAPGGVTAVPENTNTVKSRNDLNMLRGIYFAVQSAPGTAPVLPAPAPQYPSVVALLNMEEQGRAAVALGRVQIVEIIGAFNRKVRGSLGHTTFPSGLPGLPAVTDSLKMINDAANDVFDLWTAINALPAPPPTPTPAFTGPLLIPVSVPGTNSVQMLTFAEAFARLTAMRNGSAAMLTAQNGLKVMRPHRDNIWENEIRPLIQAYIKKIQGEYPPEHAFVTSLPRLYPAPGHTPEAVNLTGNYNTATQQGDYAWSASDEPTLDRIEIRQSPGPEYADDAYTVLATFPPGGPLNLSTPTGFEIPGQTSSVKAYVILATGNERGSNTVTLTRPL
jgi:hypothetical protein